jgi:oligopeptide/dipeptide ABC transporter ATP-binding protein
MSREALGDRRAEALVGAEPDADAEAAAAAEPPILQVEHLSVHLPLHRGVGGRGHEVVRALDDVTIAVAPGESLGVVGESGCGKTTLIRSAARLTEATAGKISVEGRDITRASRRSLAPVRAKMQMVFQDPEASLNPRKRVSQILVTPLRRRGVPRRRHGEEIARLLAEVGLSAEHSHSHPHELSGGQRQRVGLARALATEPRLLLLDEPVSALDVSIRAQIVNLLSDLREREHSRSSGGRLALLFVAHDLAVVRQVSDRIAVMYLGKIVESGPAERLCSSPVHPYTQALLAAVPSPDPAAGPPRVELAGEPPSAVAPPPGCRFHPRCPYATEVCTEVEPPLVEYRGDRLAACHHPLNVSEAEVQDSALA